MTLGTFERILDSFPFVTTVGLIGLGEPLLHPNFLEIMKILKSRKIAIDSSTNGTLLDEKMAQALVALNVDQLAISVDGATSNTFESIRTGAKFGQVIENTKILVNEKKKAKKTKPHITFTIVGMRQNVVELPALIELAHQVGVEEVCFQHISSYSREIDKRHLDQSEETATILRKAIQISSKNGVELALRPLEPTPQPCLMPWFGLYITQDGDVRACPYIGCLTCPMEEWYEGIPIPTNPEDVTFGNVLKEDFRDIWNCQKYRRFRTELKRFMKEDKEQEWNVEKYCDLRKSHPNNYCRICQWRFMTGC